jgi:glutaredoxin
MKIANIKSMKTLALILVVSLLALSACGEVKDGKYAAIAKCLTSKGVKFYGAYWCPHCAEQKKIFGSDMRYINYIECDQNGPNSKRDECISAGVQAYPSWFFPGQDLSVGVQDPVELAHKANCEVGSVTPIDQGGANGNKQTSSPNATTGSNSSSGVPLETNSSLPVTAEVQPK